MTRTELQPHLDSAFRTSLLYSMAIMVVLLAIPFAGVLSFMAPDQASIFETASRGVWIAFTILLAPTAFLFAQLEEGCRTKYSKSLDDLYLGTRWMLSDGTVGVVQDVDHFGQLLSVALPDGRAERYDINVLRLVDEKTGLLPSGHLASLSPEAALEELRLRNSHLMKNAFVFLLVTIAGFIAAFTFVPDGNEPRYVLLRMLCVLPPLLGLAVACIRSRVLHDGFSRETLIRKFSGGLWKVPDGRVGKFGLLSEDEKVVTLVMDDQTLSSISHRNLVRA